MIHDRTDHDVFIHITIQGILMISDTFQDNIGAQNTHWFETAPKTHQNSKKKFLGVHTIFFAEVPYDLMVKLKQKSLTISQDIRVKM